MGAGPTADTPYKSTFFKEYRVQIPAADHGNALVASVLLYGPIVYRLVHRPVTAVGGVRFPLGPPSSFELISGIDVSPSEKDKNHLQNNNRNK